MSRYLVKETYLKKDKTSYNLEWMEYHFTLAYPHMKIQFNTMVATLRQKILNEKCEGFEIFFK
jgi:hypothetical protein